MKRRFVIPAAVAMALHTLLLFGFRTAHPAAIGRPLIPTAAPNPTDPVTVEWVTVQDDPDAAAPSSRPVAPRPELPELPPPEHNPEFHMIPSVPSPTPNGPTAKLPVGPFGDPNSKGDRIGTGGPGPINSILLDHAPRTRAQVAPIYPYEARVTGRPGEVLVAFVVDEAGHVLDPHVVRSSDPVFEAPTLRAVAKWRFEPGRSNGRVVRFRMAVPVAFTVSPEAGR